MTFLYEEFDMLTRHGVIANKRFNLIEDNLSAKFPIREYQIKSFARFDHFLNTEFEGKQSKPLHLLYNMATGSGKTLVMAGLMLYLYEKGFRNFLFFVNSNNIISKTKDNFLNPASSKYLFAEKIVIDGKEIYIKETDTFESADNENINIKFTTIHQLHIDLNNTKENSVTYEDFQDQKMVLIADEAHHLSSATRGNGDLFGSWEGTVLEILKQNYDNILLEFTATIDYESRELVDKYCDKVIYKYDLSEFRKDGYSKEINLIRSMYDERERIIQALILNLYRQELATSNNVNLKPVILFKAKRTIGESELNKTNFHKLIDELSADHIQKIRKNSSVEIVKKAFAFFDGRNVTNGEIAKRIKANFREENCLSANNDAEAELNQIRLNTLEDENNPIRAVFAVQKLNEGWDVLNLFDIVRLYEGHGGRHNQPGNTTISEAQLIGRGARYFPFALEEGQDKFTRKYDDDLNNDLKIMEELYYHAKEDSRYITELKIALVESGIYEDNLVTKELKLKPEFKATEFYKDGRVIFNKKIPKSYDNVQSFADLGVKKRDFSFELSSGFGKMTGAFVTRETQSDDEVKTVSNIPLADIPKQVVRYALSQNPFFYFDRIEKYFPNVNSTSEFIESENYLGGLEIRFVAPKARLAVITHEDFLAALQGILQSIEREIKSNLTEWEGSEFIYDYIRKIFADKNIRVPKNSKRAEGQEEIVGDKDWYVYTANYGTEEEKSFVASFAARFENLSEKFKEIYLIRNERELKIVDELGRAFEPDFVLFCKQKDGEEFIYQVFIEPKGQHIAPHDQWKQDFLIKIGKERKTLRINTDSYVIIGVPFYNASNENKFFEQFEDVLS